MKKLSQRGWVVAVSGAVLLGAPALASDPLPAGELKQTTRTLEELHHANRSEVEMGRMAQERAMDKKTKDFADRMVKDHTQMDNDVMTFAKDNGIRLMDTMPAEHGESQEMKEAMNHLMSLKGPQFDHA